MIVRIESLILRLEVKIRAVKAKFGTRNATSAVRMDLALNVSENVTKTFELNLFSERDKPFCFAIGTKFPI